VREAAAAVVLRVVLRVVRLRRGGDGGLVLRRVLLQRGRRAAPVQLQALRAAPPCGAVGAVTRRVSGSVGWALCS
jgi:hypothetical protein